MSTSDNFMGLPHTVLSLRSDASLNFWDRELLAGFHSPLCSDVSSLEHFFAFCPWASVKLWWEMPVGACWPYVHVPRIHEVYVQAGPYV